MLRRPHWKWHIPLYFFLSGLAGTSYAVATVLEWLGSERDRPITAAGRYLALGGVAASVPLLVDDLGRPERFHHMLRVFKPRSPMSMGSWALTLFGGFAGLSAVLQLVAAPAGARRLVGLAGLPSALFVASYTGVLLSATAVPLWARARLFLPPTFVLSGASTALAALSLLTGRHARLRRLGLVVVAGELAAVAGMLRVLGPRLGRPLLAGRLAPPFWVGAVGLGQLLPLLLHGRHRRGGPDGGWPDRLAAGLVLVGGLVTRWVVVEAGKASADDPAAAVEHHG